MKKVRLLRLIAWVLFAQMLGGVIWASLKSNLFLEAGELVKIPWMLITLQDFYTNVFYLMLWMVFREKTWPLRMTWGLGFVLLGSLATSLYLIWASYEIDEEKPFQSLLLGRHQ